MKLGFIGLGAMGSAMARRLVEAGHEVTVWNRSGDKMQALTAAGAKAASSPAEASSGAEAVLSSVSNDAALRAVTEGPDGIIAGLAKGAVHLSTSTVSIGLTRHLAAAHAEKGQVLLSTPVLGRPPAAAEGKLFIMMAGDAAAAARVKPVLETIGQRSFPLGDSPEQANLAKLACNFLIFSTIEQFAEVFAITEKGGLDRGAMFELLTESFFSAPVHKNYGKLIRDRQYEPGVPVTLGLKDTQLFLEAGTDLQAPLPIASLLRDRYLAAMARGEGEKDFTVIARQVGEQAGIE